MRKLRQGLERQEKEEENEKKRFTCILCERERKKEGDVRRRRIQESRDERCKGYIARVI